MALPHRLSYSDTGTEKRKKKKQPQKAFVKVAAVVVSLGVSSLQPFPSKGISCGRMEIGPWASKCSSPCRPVCLAFVQKGALLFTSNHSELFSRSKMLLLQ